MEKQQNYQELLIAAVIFLGIALAGLFDGVVLHKVLQWHHMLSSVNPPTNATNVELNDLWDGIFLAGTYTILGIGLLLLFLASQRGNIFNSSKIWAGCSAIGFGGFNIVEGLIDHQILGIHHVKSGTNEFAWDMGFLALNLVVFVIGWIVLRSEAREAGTS